MSNASESMPTLSLAFVLPAVGPTATHDDDVMELLLYAGARIEHHTLEHPGRALTVTVLTNDSVTGGWARLQADIAPLMLPLCRLVVIPEPEVPCIGEQRLRETYQLLEHLKGEAFDEVHYLDHGGVGFYPTQAKRLGLAFHTSQFIVHIVGGAVFRAGVDDRPLDSVASLVEDLLERESVARADQVLVHDGPAWDWYADKIELPDTERVRLLARPAPAVDTNSPAASSFPVIEGRMGMSSLAFYGPLGTGSALPLFCDAVDHLTSGTMQVALPAGLVVVGSPGAVGGIDAVSYVRVRQPRWKRPVVLRTDLSLADEVAFLRENAAAVVCDPRRSQNLRTRLVRAAHHAVVTVGTHPCADTPAALATAMAEAMNAVSPFQTSDPIDLLELWRAVHTLPSSLDLATSPALDRSIDGPLVSVCITHHQRPEKLRTALRSLEAQTYANIEVIVVDDGSPDPMVQAELVLIEQEIEARGWKVIRQANRYLGAARNTAVRHASGALLLFMDDDNAAKPNEIETLVAVQQRTGADVVTCFCDVFENDAELSNGLCAGLRFTPMGSDVALGLLNNCFGDANALWSRGAFEQLGGFTEDWGITHEDWELFCRASLAGMTLVCVPEALFWYRIDAAGMSRGPRKQLLEVANRRRHLRPYLEKLPYAQAKIAQLAQALAMPAPSSVVGAVTSARPAERRRGDHLPFARVVIVMRTKDRPLLLRRAVESVVAQTYGDWLLVVVNDGGDPEIVELVLQPYVDQLRDRVIVISHPFSVGMQTASNAAVMRSASEFVVVHDDDDSWRPTFLARTVTYLDDNAWRPKSGAVVTWSTLVTETIDEASGEIVSTGRQLFNQIGSIGLVDMAIENRFPPIAFVFRRAVLETIGPFEEKHGPLGDWEFNLRVLARFDIDVIAEPLANYHHRPVTSNGHYGNSVHAEQASHAARRVDLVNGVLRSSPGPGGVGFAQVVVAGEFHHQAMLEQKREFQRLHDYLWNLEQRINNLTQKLDPDRSGRNKIRNGDFRLGCGPANDIRPVGEHWAYRELTPGISLSYDGVQVVFRSEARTWGGESTQLPVGKTYLRIEKDAGSRHATWFVLQFEVPADAVGAFPVCISARARLEAPSPWVEVSGRHELESGDHLPWATSQIWLGDEFGRFATVFPATELILPKDSGRVVHRVMLRLPVQSEFVLEITDLQVEIGSIASEFEFRPVDVVPVRGRRIGRVARTLRRRWSR